MTIMTLRKRKTTPYPMEIGGLPIREFLAVVAIGAALLLLFYGMHYLYSGRYRDQQGALPLEGLGTVTRVDLTSDTRGGLHPGCVELDGRPVTLDLWDSESAQRLKVGQKVAFTYRVGRSGAWYIRQIAVGSPPSGTAFGDRR